MDRGISAAEGGRTSAGVSELADIVNSSMTVAIERGTTEPGLAEAVLTLESLIDRYYVTIPWAERMMVLSQVVRHMTDQVTVMGIFLM